MNYDIEYVSLEKASKFNYSHILTVIREDGVFDVVSDFYTTLKIKDYPYFFRDTLSGSGSYDFLISFSRSLHETDSDHIILEANFQTVVIPKSFFNKLNKQIAKLAILGIEKFGLLERGVVDPMWQQDISTWLLNMRAKSVSPQRSLAYASDI